MPYGVVADSQDHIILGDYGSGHLYRFDPENESWTTFTPPTYPAQVRRPNVDEEDNIWYPIYAQGPRTDRFGKLGMLNQRTGKFTEYVVPRQRARPYDVAPDPFGNIWSADGGGRFTAIWSFDTEDETFTIYPKPQPEADSPKIQVTRDGAIWYSPRGSVDAPGMAVLYPDMDKITSVESLGAYYVNGTAGLSLRAGGCQGLEQANNPLVQGGVTYVAHSVKVIQALDGTTGVLIWEYQTVRLRPDLGRRQGRCAERAVDLTQRLPRPPNAYSHPRFPRREMSATDVPNGGGGAAPRHLPTHHSTEVRQLRPDWLAARAYSPASRPPPTVRPGRAETRLYRAS